MKQYFTMLLAAFKAWQEDKAPVFSAALSYYTVFSLGPLLLVLIGAAGLLFGREATEGEIYSQLQGLFGREGAGMVENMVEGARKPQSGVISIVIGLFLLLLSASGVFGQLKQSLNTVWKVEPKPGKGIVSVFRERFLSFSMVGVIAFLLAVSLIASAAISAIATYFTGLLPVPPFILEAINFLISFGILTLLFACIYKILPDIVIPWKVVWVGAIFTALLFTIGKTVIGLYIGNSAASSTYGVAASFVVILLWVYYASLILFLGAEFTKVYALEKGITMKPSKFAQFSEPMIKTEELQPINESRQNAAATFFGYAVQGFVQRVFEESKSKKQNRSEKKKRPR